LILGIVEVLNTLRSLSNEKEQISGYYFDDIKQSKKNIKDEK
jgi:hypothetical protein